MVEFDSVFDENTAKALNRLTLKKIWWLFVIVSLAACILGVDSLLQNEPVIGSIMLVIGVLFTPLTLLLSQVTQKKLNQSMTLLSSETKEYFRFEEQKMLVRQTKGNEYLSTTEAAYAHLYQVIETKDCYFLYISKAQAYVVFKNSLIFGSLDELNFILTNNLGSRFKRQK